MRTARMPGLSVVSLLFASVFFLGQSAQVHAEDPPLPTETPAETLGCDKEPEITFKAEALPLYFEHWCQATARTHYQFTLGVKADSGAPVTHVTIERDEELKEYALKFSIALYKATLQDDGSLKLEKQEYDENDANKSGVGPATLTKANEGDADELWYVKYTLSSEYPLEGASSVALASSIDVVPGGGCFDCDGFGQPIQYTEMVWPPRFFDWTEDFFVNPVPLPVGRGPGIMLSPWFTEGLLDPTQWWGGVGQLDANILAIPN